MFLNLEIMTTVKILILKIILQGENDKEYYGNSILFNKLLNMLLKFSTSIFYLRFFFHL